MNEFVLTYELKALMACVALLFFITLVQAVYGLMNYGILRVVGTREDIPFPAPGLGGRAQRALNNHMEALAMFTPLVIVATLTGVSTIVTIWAAKIFFLARLIHALVYLAGIPWLRTLAFSVGIMSLIAIGHEILQAKVF